MQRLPFVCPCIKADGDPNQNGTLWRSCVGIRNHHPSQDAHLLPDCACLFLYKPLCILDCSVLQQGWRNTSKSRVLVKSVQPVLTSIMCYPSAFQGPPKRAIVLHKADVHAAAGIWLAVPTQQGV